jgi:hypothetical protein
MTMIEPRRIAALVGVTVLGFGASFVLGRSGNDGHRADAEAVGPPVELNVSSTVAAGTLPEPAPVPDLVVPRAAPAPVAPAPVAPAPSPRAAAPRPSTATSTQEPPTTTSATPPPASQQQATPPSTPKEQAPTVTVIGG